MCSEFGKYSISIEAVGAAFVFTHFLIEDYVAQWIWCDANRIDSMHILEVFVMAN